MQPAVILSQKDITKLKKLAVAFATLVERLDWKPAPAPKSRKARAAAVPPAGASA